MVPYYVLVHQGIYVIVKSLIQDSILKKRYNNIDLENKGLKFEKYYVQNSLGKPLDGSPYGFLKLLTIKKSA
ncbi:hypothetical protein SDC9_134247 [bioreactor metagenome]|uniref:Uncharacterized protein n=1 Tax=bioreactor metagenome TaxID=1076179 RepID=A0A645DE77_9ZZZZ